LITLLLLEAVAVVELLAVVVAQEACVQQLPQQVAVEV
jgi:hypothetical protein